MSDRNYNLRLPGLESFCYFSLLYVWQCCKKINKRTWRKIFSSLCFLSRDIFPWTLKLYSNSWQIGCAITRNGLQITAVSVTLNCKFPPQNAEINFKSFNCSERKLKRLKESLSARNLKQYSSRNLLNLSDGDFMQIKDHVLLVTMFCLVELIEFPYETQVKRSCFE